MNKHYDPFKRGELERHERWDYWIPKIPFLQFPSHWHVTIIPPWAGVLVRFRVNLPNETDYTSVYLDGNQAAGFWSFNLNEAYWEVYPTPEGDTARCAMEDTATLMDLIKTSVERKEKK